MGIRDRPTAPRSPWQNGYAERLIGSIEAARREATLGLADFAKDAIPGSVRRELAVEVREHTEHALLRATLWFEVTVHA